MKPEDFTKLTTQIAQNLGNQALVTDLLTQINEAYTNTHTSQETLLEQTNDFKEKIDTLQKTNMNLFLKVSNPVPDEKLNTEKPLQYEDLINDLGGNK